LERVAEKYGWRRGTKQELTSRARLVMEKIDKRYLYFALDNLLQDCTVCSNGKSNGTSENLHASHNQTILIPTTQNSFKSFYFV